MRHVLMLTAALAMLTVAVPTAHAQHLDAKGKCHGADGKFAKAEVCKSGPAHTYKLDAKGKCRDEGGRFAKKEMCHH